MGKGRRGLIATTIATTLALPTVAQATVDAPAPRTLAPAPVLIGEVGPGYTITLKNRAGAPVRRVRPGRYTFIVRDRATNHDFRLRGPGLNLTTGVAPRVTKRWTVRLRAGRYIYLCTPHPLFMRGVLVVG
jgi:hypothetical protein